MLGEYSAMREERLWKTNRAESRVVFVRDGAGPLPTAGGLGSAYSVPSLGSVHHFSFQVLRVAFSTIFLGSCYYKF